MSGISYCANVKNDIERKLPKKNCCLRTRKTALSVMSTHDSGSDKLFRLISLPRCENCRAELLKALFVSYGTVADPDKELHLEFVSKDPDVRDFIKQVLISSGFEPKLSTRNGYFTCYFKDGDVIKDVFGKMGVNSVVFDVINRKMIGEIKNSANRLVNFETANIKKSIGASAKYIEAIKYLDSHGILSTLPPELEEAARIRMENFQMSLSELARQTKPPISKSGFLHRLDRILEIADKVKKRGARVSDE